MKTCCEERVGEKFNEWSETYDDDLSGMAAYQETIARISDQVVSHGASVVLDIGTGTGSLLLALSKRMKAKFFGIDISDQMLKKAGERFKENGVDVELKKGSFLSIPLANHSVDTVISNMALHHLPDSKKAQAAMEISRVLKNGGRAIIGDIIFFDPLDWSDATEENVLEKIKKAFGEDLKPEDVCCNMKRILEMLREEYPTQAENLKEFFEESGFQVQIDKVKYWFGILSAIQQHKI